MILLPGANDLMVDYQSWLARAARARNIAGLLAPNDAEIVDAYARECEIEARRLIGSQAWHPKAA
jgi:hypothetical protein